MIISVGNGLVFDKSQFCHAVESDLYIYIYLAGDHYYKIAFRDSESAKNAFSRLMGDIGLSQVCDKADSFDFVTIPYSKPFKLSKTVITQKQWREVMGTTPWAGKEYVVEGDDYPAVYINWNDAMDFCQRLSVSGKTYRLPTEAEWEFACRGGSTTDFHFGNDESQLGNYAWYWENCRNEQYAHPVAQKLPNQYGLYDMHGNVWEWCQDSFGSSRIIRGGSWLSLGTNARSGNRDDVNPDNTYNDAGFRVVAE